MKRIAIIFLFISVVAVRAKAQDEVVALSEDSIPARKTSVWKASCPGLAISAVFISYGVLAHHQDDIRELDYKIQRESIHFKKQVYADDYLRFVPGLSMYGMDLMGVKAKHSLRDRTFLFTSSFLISTASVQVLKRTTNIRRPDESSYLSFPSGHTATAFAGAHLLLKEYRDTSPWIGIAGYTVASCTGVMRIFNNRHWFSDVMAGAGFGILSTEISYLLLPVFHKLPGIKNTQTNMVIAPAIGNSQFGVGLACTF